MKRLVLLIVAILCIASVSAQDTLVNSLKPEYFYNHHWVGEGGRHSWIILENCTQYLFAEFYAAKPMKVYGMAVFVLPKEKNEFCYTPDSNSTDFFGLFVRNLDNPVFYGENLLQSEHSPVKLISDSLFLNPGEVEPTCYFRYNNTDVILNEDCYDRVYELYFDSAITVDGYFMLGRSTTGYIGIKENKWRIPETCGKMKDSIVPVYYMVYNSGGKSSFFPEYNYAKYYDYVSLEYIYNNNTSLDKCCPITGVDRFLWFPIINPDEIDTTSSPDDTLFIGKEPLMQRYVSVQPNPAVGEVTVLSSVGMEEVEAYNMSGEKVAQWKATGLNTQLDVSQLPSGVYILQVKTAMGVVHKKLVVQ